MKTLAKTLAKIIVFIGKCCRFLVGGALCVSILYIAYAYAEHVLSDKDKFMTSVVVCGVMVAAVELYRWAESVLEKD